MDRLLSLPFYLPQETLFLRCYRLEDMIIVCLHRSTCSWLPSKFIVNLKTFLTVVIYCSNFTLDASQSFRFPELVNVLRNVTLKTAVTSVVDLNCPPKPTPASILPLSCTHIDDLRWRVSPEVIVQEKPRAVCQSMPAPGVDRLARLQSWLTHPLAASALKASGPLPTTPKPSEVLPFLCGLGSCRFPRGSLTHPVRSSSRGFEAVHFRVISTISLFITQNHAVLCEQLAAPLNTPHATHQYCSLFV